MPDQGGKLIVGCVRVSEPGACQLCQSWNGREFYYHPRDGQAPVKDMPREPLHPNCRCRTEPIYGLDEVLAKLRDRQPVHDEWGQEIPEPLEINRERWKREYPSF